MPTKSDTCVVGSCNLGTLSDELRYLTILRIPISIIPLITDVSTADAAHIPPPHRFPFIPAWNKKGDCKEFFDAASPIVVISPLEYYSPSPITFPIAFSET